jgi:2-iminobutanoate/2-iminopropanoate deaminase
MKMRIVTDQAPPAMPVFSQGVRKGPLFSVSGQGGADPVTGAFTADVAAQTTQTLQNVRAILVSGGASFDDIVQLRVYLTTRDDFAAMNAAYTEFMAENVPGGILPARTTVFVGLPLPQMLVEIDALAAPE